MTNYFKTCNKGFVRKALANNNKKKNAAHKYIKSPVRRKGNGKYNNQNKTK